MKEIFLTQGKVALVDDEDYDYLVAMGKWRCNSYGYAVRTLNYKTSSGKWKQKNVIMHRVIMRAPKEMQVDHRWGDKLDNRKENLRICTHNDNQQNRDAPINNTSGFKGVYWFKRDGKWKAQISVNSKEIHLGMFTCPIEAACVYNAAAHEYHGEFARLNPILEDYIVDDQKINLLFKNHWNKGFYRNNTSGFKGVSWNKVKEKWGAKIYVNSKGIHLGYFSSPIDAALAYNAAAIKHHGEFAKLNCIPTLP